LEKHPQPSSLIPTPTLLTIAMTTRKTRSPKPAAPTDVKVTSEEARIESPVVDPKTKDSTPVNIETETPSDDPVAAPEATPAEKIQTDVREKLAKKSTEEDVFVPTTPAALEKAATEVAKDKGFELNRGTSIGARLMARAGKSI
jgi:hypothetical protein